MISANLYPTAAQYFNNNLSVTNNVHQTAATVDGVGNPYFMGYIPFDEFPKLLSVKTIDGTNGLHFSEIKNNHSWGFLWCNSTSGTLQYPPNMRIAVKNTTTVDYDNNGTKFNFINKIKMANVAYLDFVTLQGRYMLVSTADLSDDDTTPFAAHIFGNYPPYSDTGITNTIKIETLYNIVKNYVPYAPDFTTTFNYNGQSYTRTFPGLYYRDFNEYGLAKLQSIDGNGDFTIFVCISDFNSLNKSGLTYKTTTNVLRVDNTDIVPFFETTTNDTKILYTQGASFGDIRLNYYHGQKNFTVWNSGEITIDGDTFYFFNFPDILPTDFDNALPNMSAVIGGKYFVEPTGFGSDFYQYNIKYHYDLNDIYTYILYLHKIQLNCFNIAQFTASETYTTDNSTSLFNDNDAALNDRRVSNYADISDILRSWQQPDTNITVNDYDPADMPPYVDDTDTDSGGDDIRPTDWTNLQISAANNFVTLYGMTAQTLTDFGRKMWAALSDPAFWQMVGTAFTNDFSINPADMMRYFISLRYFPFDVSAFAHSTASGIYVGRAAAPIAPSVGVAYPIRLSNNAVQIYGGSLTIRRHYFDFRDFEPCTTVQITVPFCGTVDVPASEIMNHEMDITYKIDLQTGAMLAVIGVSSDTYYVIATLAGNCGATVPITAGNTVEFLQRIATVGNGIMSGGLSGAVKGANVGAVPGAIVGAVAGTIGGGVGAMAGLPPVTVHKQGNASGFANLGAVPYAYATVQRGRFVVPENYGHTSGYACDFAAVLGTLSGFTVCDNVDTSGLTCNARERDEIKRLLESGVYI